MSRYVLVAGKRSTIADPSIVLSRSGVEILDRTANQAFLFEADDAAIAAIRAALPGCTISPEVVHPPPIPVQPTRVGAAIRETLTA